LWQIKVKKLDPQALMPSKGSSGAACWDIYALEDTELKVWSVTMVRTGLAVEVPRGFFLDIRPRSGLSNKIRVANAPGTLDSDYRGEMLVMLCANDYEREFIKKGDRIAQVRLERENKIEWVEVEELSPSRRGSKGFGSTGR